MFFEITLQSVTSICEVKTRILFVDVKFEFCLPLWTFFKTFDMNKNINLLELSYDEVNAMKKKRLGRLNRENEG